MPAKLYLNGTVVDYSEPPKHARDNIKPENRSKDFRVFSINFRNRMKICDCGVLQHYEACELNNLDQFFVTCTYNANQFVRTDNKDITRFCDKLNRKFENFSYIWVKEYTKKGCPHYHCLMNIENVPNRKEDFKNWIKKHNDIWCNVRGHYSKNALDISKVNNTKKCLQYITKYITKSNESLTEENKKQLIHNGKKSNGRVWSASNSLKQNANPVFLPSSMSFTRNRYYNPQQRFIKNDFCEITFLETSRIYTLYQGLYKDQIKKNS